MTLTNEQHCILVEWIENNLIAQQKTNYNVDTSKIRESFCSLYVHGFYIDNYTLNSVLQEYGFIPANLSKNPYLCWNISSKSRAIEKYQSSRGVPSEDQWYE